MGQKYTKSASLAMKRAKQLAIESHHRSISVEHLLLAMMKDKKSIAGKLIKDWQIKEERALATIETSVGSGVMTDNDRYYQPIYSPELEASLQKAAFYSHSLEESEVGTGHLLMGLVADLDSASQQFEINPRRWVSRLLLQQQKHDELIKNELLMTMAYQVESRTEPDKPATEDDQDNGVGTTYKDYTRNLTEEAKMGQFDTFTSREKEISQLVSVLSKNGPSNPILVGDAGVGKTAIVEGLANRIAQENVPEFLHGKTILALSLSSIEAGSRWMGVFEKKLKIVTDALEANSDLILFIDEIHMLMSAGTHSKSDVSAADMLKPLLASGKIKVIGATTTEEYQKYVEVDGAIARRFTKIVIDEPTVRETYQILRVQSNHLEQDNNVIIPDETVIAAVNLAGRYRTDKQFPGKGLDLLDQATSESSVDIQMDTPDAKIRQQIIQLRKEKIVALDKNDVDKFIKQQQKEQKLSVQLRKIVANQERQQLTIKPADIANILSKMIGLNPVQLERSVSTKELENVEDNTLENSVAEAIDPMALESEISKRVIGQQPAITALSRAIRRAKAGLSDATKPMGTFMFMGPTGVGKTELVKALAKVVFGSEEAIIRLDMSEYSHYGSAQRLIGYADTPGTLTAKVHEKPYSIVLLDEFEKADRNVANMLLQVFDDGVLTDAHNRKVNFKNTIMVMTSNVGAAIARNQKTLGFGASKDINNEAAAEKMQEVLKETFAPEFLNRIDEVIVFNPLTQEEIQEIVPLTLKRVFRGVENQGMAITATKKATKWFAEKGYDSENGARPLARLVQSELQDQLATDILTNKLSRGDQIKVDVKDDKITLQIEKSN